MRKLFVIALLIVGASSFASSGKVAKKIKVKKATVSCCTVGTYTHCGSDGSLNCHNALVQYCQNHSCSSGTLKSIKDFRKKTLSFE